MRLSLAIVSLVALLATELPALAQPAPVPTALPEAPPPRPKSPTTATVLPLAIVGTSVGLLLVAEALPFQNRDPKDVLTVAAGAGLLLGPSAGHWYSHDWLTAGLVARGVATAALIGYEFTAVESCLDNDCDDARLYAGYAVIGAVFAAGAIYDIATSPGAARDYNREHEIDVELAPTAMRTSSGLAPGLAVVGRF